jgi:pseudouridine kinase
VVVVGGAVYDLVAKSFDSIDANIRTSLPGLTVSSFGGVGRNIAETLARLGRQVSLVSAVGDDYQGRALSSHARQLGVDTTNLLTASSRHHKTATYTAIHDKDGDLYVGIADMEIFKSITESVIQGIYGAVRKSKCVVVDGNLEPEIFATLVKFCHTYRVPVFFEPTSNHKCVAPIDTDTLHMVRINWMLIIETFLMPPNLRSTSSSPM